MHIKTAAELLEGGVRARWEDRATVDLAARRVLAAVLEHVVAHGIAPGARDVGALLPDLGLDAVEAALHRLDAADLLLLDDGRVTLAYPFAARPTAFEVVLLRDGTRRWACCAIDALGIPALLDEGVRIEASCHDCGEPLAIGVTPSGPIASEGSAAEPGIMVWVGEREQLRAKACDGL
ncbi:MAG TPA: organomercurial lyase [Solirubrobacteraceae bacterium]